MRALNSQDFALLSDHIYGKKDENGEKKLVFDNEKNKEITLNGIKYAVKESAIIQKMVILVPFTVA